MVYIIPKYLYYLSFGLAIGLLTLLTVGTLYINKVRYNMQVDFEKTGTKIPIGTSEKIIRLLCFLVGFIGIVVAEFFMLPNGGSGAEITKTIVFGIGISCFAVLAVLDIKYGEVYVYELGIANTLCLFILPIIVNFIFGCKCISKGLLITLGVYIVIKVVNYIFNKELSIGGADIDTLAAFVAASIGVVLAINHREQTPIFVESYFLERLLSIVFINFTVAIVVYYINKLIKKIRKKGKEDVSNEAVKETETNVTENTEQTTEKHISESDQDSTKPKKEKKRDFRCLPAFILIYSFILFFILFY